jgi:hypothetical protein
MTHITSAASPERISRIAELKERYTKMREQILVDTGFPLHKLTDAPFYTGGPIPCQSPPIQNPSIIDLSLVKHPVMQGKDETGQPVYLFDSTGSLPPSTDTETAGKIEAFFMRNGIVFSYKWNKKIEFDQTGEKRQISSGFENQFDIPVGNNPSPAAIQTRLLSLFPQVSLSYSDPALVTALASILPSNITSDLTTIIAEYSAEKPHLCFRNITPEIHRKLLSCNLSDYAEKWYDLEDLDELLQALRI